MASPRVEQRLEWRVVTVAETERETPTARTLRVAVDDWPGHRPGQHVDVRLTADDGYQATRSYSLSSGPDEEPQITVERVDDGEVSPFLVDVAAPGTKVELRGPVGGYFVWDPTNRPVLLVGGGSGIAPLRSMWRARPDDAAMTVVYSARTSDRIIYADELADDGFDVELFVSREQVAGAHRGRIDADRLQSIVDRRRPEQTFVCGPTAFVETATGGLVAAGIDARTIRTERFG
ncbi:MAG: FAD-binding oxidoreductase [Acidimicrobiales bacterium]